MPRVLTRLVVDLPEDADPFKIGEVKPWLVEQFGDAVAVEIQVTTDYTQPRGHWEQVSVDKLD